MSSIIACMIYRNSIIKIIYKHSIMKRLPLLFLFVFFNIACDTLVSGSEFGENLPEEPGTAEMQQAQLLAPGKSADSIATSVAFQWEKVNGALLYALQLSSAADFSQNIADSVLATTSFEILGLEHSTSYYWRVRPIGENYASGPWSETWNFSTLGQPGEETPVTTTLVNPGNGFKDQQTDLTLQWAEVFNAKGYRLQLSAEPVFSSPLKDTVAESNSYHVNALSYGETYYWRVEPIIENAKTQWSEVFNFSIKAADVDITNPAISVSSSKEIVAEGEPVTVTASASDPSGISSIELYVDERKVETCSGSATCSHSSSSYPAGPHTYHAIAVDASSNANQSQSEVKKFNVATISPTGDVVKIMPLGDSITEAFGYRIPLWNKLTGKGYSIDYVGSQSDPHPDLPDTDHEGHGGWYIGHISKEINGWLATYQPDIVLLMIGTNDVAWWTPRTGAEIADAHAALVDKILANTPAGTWVLTASIPPQSSEIIEPNMIDRAQLARDYNAEMKKRMQQRIDNGKNIVLVDMHSKLTVDMLSDGIHPKSEGYEIIAQAWFEKLLTVLP